MAWHGYADMLTFRDWLEGLLVQFNIPNPPRGRDGDRAAIADHPLTSQSPALRFKPCPAGKPCQLTASIDLCGITRKSR